MEFLKWWLKSIKWKNNILTFLIYIVIIFLYLLIIISLKLSDKYMWAKISTAIILILFLIMTILYLFFGIKYYFNMKKNEYKIEKEDK